MKTILNILFVASISLSGSSHAVAQKLPSTQQINLRAPSNLKIDGKATEWDNKFQAYNKATGIFYMLANDDENLYLIIQAEKPRVIEKILSSGITFTVNSKGEKSANAKENVSVTFPMLSLSNAYQILFNAGARAKSDVEVPESVARRDTTRYSRNHTDSLTTLANNLLMANAKIINIKGMSGLTDESISVYNEEKIRVAASFDHAANYTYELALPLKHLGLVINESKPFTYNIRLNGRLTNIKRGLATHYIYQNGNQVDVDADLNYTTDFWATYTLAKK